MSYKLTPLGGVGEIGHNTMVVKTATEWIVIDAGILFPHESYYNLQYLIPDFTALDPILTTSLVVTHAHEDHIGAIPHLLNILPGITIYASPLAKEMILLKLRTFLTNLPQEQKHLYPSIDSLSNQFVIFHQESILSFSSIDIHPIHVNHSIPETYGLLIQDKEKIVSSLYISDCKHDASSPYENVMSIERAHQLSLNSKVRMLLLDSTNILYDQKTPSEAVVINPLTEIIKSHPERIFIIFFPSNIHRLQTLINIAKNLNKKIIYYGRSLVNFSETAQQLGLLTNYHETKLTDVKDEFASSIHNAFPDEGLMILLTGCQGDLKGALNRIVSGYDPIFKLRKEDLILFSSRVIPGNEKRMATIYNKIYKQGASILTSYDDNVHVSGHLSAADVPMVVDKFLPTHFVPIHGENYFLHRHAKLIRNLYPHICVHVINNYDTIEIDPQTYIITQTEGNPLPALFIQDNGLPIEKSAINLRKKLAYQGAAFVTVTTKPLHFRIALIALPSFVEDQKEDLIKFLKASLTINLDSKIMEENVRILTRNYLSTLLLYRPLVVVHVNLFS